MSDTTLWSKLNRGSPLPRGGRADATEGWQAEATFVFVPEPPELMADVPAVGGPADGRMLPLFSRTAVRVPVAPPIRVVYKPEEEPDLGPMKVVDYVLDVEVVARWVLRPYNPREAHRGDR